MERHPSLDDRFDPAIRIAAHDPAWPGLAEAEMRRIADALGDLAVRVDHVGSTAVPGLAAKPIVDLQLSVPRIGALDSYREPLERLGYLFVPDPDVPNFHFFALPAERPRTHHLHPCESGSEHERRHLAVRDFLRTHPEVASEYEALKRRLVADHPDDRIAYIEGKEAFMPPSRTAPSPDDCVSSGGAGPARRRGVPAQPDRAGQAPHGPPMP